MNPASARDYGAGLFIAGIVIGVGWGVGSVVVMLAGVVIGVYPAWRLGG